MTKNKLKLTRKLVYVYPGQANEIVGDTYNQEVYGMAVISSPLQTIFSQSGMIPKVSSAKVHIHLQAGFPVTVIPCVVIYDGSITTTESLQVAQCVADDLDTAITGNFIYHAFAPLLVYNGPSANADSPMSIKRTINITNFVNRYINGDYFDVVGADDGALAIVGIIKSPVLGTSDPEVETFVTFEMDYIEIPRRM